MMLFKLTIFFIIAFVSGAGNLYAQNKVNDLYEINMLLNTMWTSDWGTRKDSESYMAHDERELSLLLKKCHDYGWSSDPLSPECLDYTRSYWSDKNKPSIFLTWIKKQLPPKDTVHLMNLKVMPSKECPGKQIFVNVGNHALLFYKMNSDYCPNPELFLVEIDGKNLFSEFDKGLKNGLIERFAFEQGLLPQPPLKQTEN